MTAQHTPGPWSVSVKGRGVGIIGPQSRDFPLGEHLCKMTSGRPNIHANARLIAAAPDLLEALELVTVELATCRCSRKLTTAEEIALDAARAAIAKARGQA